MSRATKRDEIARLRPLERKALLDDLAAMVRTGELRLGDAVRLLRSAVLGMDRATFARTVKVSQRAIANLEDDPDASPRLDTLRRVFAPFGGTIVLAFPRMEEPAPPTEESEQRRAALLAALARNRRQRAPR